MGEGERDAGPSSPRDKSMAIIGPLKKGRSWYLPFLLIWWFGFIGFVGFMEFVEFVVFVESIGLTRETQ